MAKYCCGDFYLAGFGVETDGADVFGLARGGGLRLAPPRLLTSAATGRDTNYVARLAVSPPISGH